MFKAAELNPEPAFRVNALGAHNAALTAAEGDLPLLHVSTDYVFDGVHGRRCLFSGPLFLLESALPSNFTQPIKSKRGEWYEQLEAGSTGDSMLSGYGRL
jgi:RmlD substrate binding domain